MEATKRMNLQKEEEEEEGDSKSQSEIQSQSQSQSQLQCPSKENVRLEDLNYDCLREIFQLLNTTTQFSVIQSCEKFKSIILHDIWTPCYKNIFDFSSDPAMAVQTIDFQCEALRIALKNFINIRGIPSTIFIKCLTDKPSEEFKQVEHLTIANDNMKIDTRILDYVQFKRFPNLVELKLERMAIDFKPNFTLPCLEVLSMHNVILANDKGGEFLPNILTPTLKELSLITLPFDEINYDKFTLMKMCYSLRELTIGAEYLHDSRALNPVMELYNLEILILQSKNSFYFKPRDHCVFQRILKKMDESSTKRLSGIQMNGMPQKSFFQLQNLKQIKHINWMVSKIFHRKANGGVEYRADIPGIIGAFNNFIETNRNLENVYIRDNKFRWTGIETVFTSPDKVLEVRAAKRYRRLNIISDYTNIPKNPYIGELPEGFVKFVFRKI